AGQPGCLVSTDCSSQRIDPSSPFTPNEEVNDSLCCLPGGQDGHVLLIGRKSVLVGDAFLMSPLCNTCTTWNICTFCTMAKVS
ncbi:hypothetical protein MC885_014822, partial [Smutsia gigantea]